MNTRRFALPALSIVSLLILCDLARADVPPPDTYSCMALNPGDVCDLDATPFSSVDAGGRRGICRVATCSRPDYANWDRDASASPPSMQYQCLKCMSGLDGGSDGALVVDGATSDVAPTSDSTHSGCAVAGPRSRAFGPWALAAAFAAMVLFARRRR
jgi:hypothetical protein